MKQFKSLLVIVLMAAAIFACKKKENEEILTIASISPASAAPGSDITITGTKFGTDASKVEVKLGTSVLAVKTVTNTQIVATIPLGAVSGPISVVIGGMTVTSSTPLTVSARTIIEITADITANATWSATNIYLLKKQFVYVQNGVTLTIQPGTIIKGDNVTKATLVIEQGGKLMAEGTATSPIVFTSNKPVGQRSYGDWGGIVLLGKAPVNRAESQAPEGGIRSTVLGGDIPTDNSGTLKYVRIEFPGVALTSSANSEINGLTLYAVGSGTVIDHVQVSYSGDDSYEWFGGTVNAKYIIAHRGFDDDFDSDWGFTGKVQFGVSLRNPAVADQSSSNGFESDNFSGTGEPATGPRAGLPLTEPTFANISIFTTNQTPSSSTTSAPGSGPYQSAMHLRRNTAISIFNTLIVGYPEGLRLDNAGTLANVTADKLQLRGIVLANVTLPYLGKNTVTDQQAQDFYTTAAYQNQVVTMADLATLSLNANSFNLTTPNFLPAAGSPLLTGALWTGKGADAFFEKVAYKGAFGTADWTTGWTNFDPQNTEYK
ncbi:MAG: IPT/TIG domain-containing protein [Bacteroidota bacterium]